MISGSKNISTSPKSITRLMKYVDSSAFRMIEDMTPARGTVSTGIIIQPHILHRSKAKQPLATGFEKNYTGSLQTGFASGSHGGAFAPISGSHIASYTTNYSTTKTTPIGPALRKVDKEQPMYTGEFGKFNRETNTFQDSVLVTTNGELSANNNFLRRVQPTFTFSVTALDLSKPPPPACYVTLQAEYIGESVYIGTSGVNDGCGTATVSVLYPGNVQDISNSNYGINWDRFSYAAFQANIAYPAVFEGWYTGPNGTGDLLSTDDTFTVYGTSEFNSGSKFYAKFDCRHTTTTTSTTTTTTTTTSTTSTTTTGAPPPPPTPPPPTTTTAPPPPPPPVYTYKVNITDSTTGADPVNGSLQSVSSLQSTYSTTGDRSLTFYMKPTSNFNFNSTSNISTSITSDTYPNRPSSVDVTTFNAADGKTYLKVTVNKNVIWTGTTTLTVLVEGSAVSTTTLPTFTFADAGVSLANGTVGNTATATASLVIISSTTNSSNGTTYLNGTTDYTVTVVVPSGYSNSGASVSGTVSAYGAPVTTTTTTQAPRTKQELIYSNSIDDLCNDRTNIDSTIYYTDHPNLHVATTLYAHNSSPTVAASVIVANGPIYHENYVQWVRTSNTTGYFTNHGSC